MWIASFGAKAQKNPMITRTALAFVLVAFSQVAFAAQSPWVTSEGGAMRLVITDDGKAPARGVLEIKLQPGWKTYWRDPGDGGIPPSLGADGMAVELLFPAPERISESDMVFSGYHNGVSLPFFLPEALVTVDKLTAFIGVCSEICVPFQAEFPLMRDQGDRALVDQAFAALPKPASADAGIVEKTRAGDQLAVKIAGMDKDAALFLAPERGVYFSIPTATADGFSVKILKEKSPGVTVNYTLKTAVGAISGIFEMPK
jgi:DsbC/DsbD-like thiol-disulfide interchange protein